jgi:hypothetical protein
MLINTINISLMNKVTLWKQGYIFNNEQFIQSYISILYRYYWYNIIQTIFLPDEINII